jgi:glycosyltransferase involved in cell wall biosynthesis
VSESDRVLRICFLSHSSMLLGAERTLLELVQYLVSDHGVNAMVVFPNRGPLVAEFERIGATPIIGRYGWWCDRQAPPIEPREHMWASMQAFERTAMPAIRNFNPDIIWTQTMVVPWGAIAAARLQKPHVWYVTEYGELDHHFNFFFVPVRTIATEIMSSSDLVYSISKSVGETLFPNASDGVRVLYPHIPSPAEAAEPRPTGFFTIPGAVKLGIFSQIVPSKGQDDIVQAVALLSSRGRNVELVIAGGGLPEYRQHLIQLARDNGIERRVKFTGFLKDVYPVLRELDISVICSRMEAFGRVGVEAMLLRKPTVYPNTGGIIECMVEGKTGYSYTPGDVSGLADRLDRQIAEPSQWALIGRFAREHALNHFSKERFSGAAYSTLRQLHLNGRRAKGMPASMEKLATAALAARQSGQVRTPGRNQPCPCGSGKRYKHCHGRAA